VQNDTNPLFFAQKFYIKVCFAKCMNVLPVASGLARPFRDLQETEGLFRKMTKDSAARHVPRESLPHVPRESLPCEQRGAGFKNSDTYILVGYRKKLIHQTKCIKTPEKRKITSRSLRSLHTRIRRRWPPSADSGTIHHQTTVHRTSIAITRLRKEP
jgi:hypothetical protein